MCDRFSQLPQEVSGFTICCRSDYWAQGSLVEGGGHYIKLGLGDKLQYLLFLEVTQLCTEQWSSSDGEAWALESVEYSFIAITLRATLTWSVSTS